LLAVLSTLERWPLPPTSIRCWNRTIVRTLKAWRKRMLRAWPSLEQLLKALEDPSVISWSLSGWNLAGRRLIRWRRCGTLRLLALICLLGLRFFSTFVHLVFSWSYNFYATRMSCRNRRLCEILRRRQVPRLGRRQFRRLRWVADAEKTGDAASASANLEV
jgi:hypothetical protein